MEPEITIDAARTAAEIERIKPFWECLNYHPESDPDFVQMLASVRQEILEPFLLVASRNGKPVSLMIGRIENAPMHFRLGYWNVLSIRIKRLVFVRDGFLGERSPEIVAKMQEAISRALEARVADFAILHGLAVDLVNNASVVSPTLPEGSSCESVQHWKSELPGDLESFLRKRSSKSRRSLARTMRNFEAEFAGRFRYAIFKSLDDASAFCKAAEAVARQTYQRGVGAGFVDHEENRRRALLMAQKGMMRAYMAFIDEQPVAFWYGERVGKVIYLAWTGFDRAYGKYEIGTILYLKMVEDLAAQGVSELDYGPGWALYKERFGDVCLNEQDIAIHAPTLKGRALGSLRNVETAVNQTGKRLLEKLKLREKVKKLWRTGLAKKAAAADPEVNASPS